MNTPITMIATEPPAWQDLVEREPRLADLRIAAERARPTADASFCANAAWYGYAG